MADSSDAWAEALTSDTKASPAMAKSARRATTSADGTVQAPSSPPPSPGRAAARRRRWSDSPQHGPELDCMSGSDDDFSRKMSSPVDAAKEQLLSNGQVPTSLYHFFQKYKKGRNRSGDMGEDIDPLQKSRERELGEANDDDVLEEIPEDCLSNPGRFSHVASSPRDSVRQSTCRSSRGTGSRSTGKSGRYSTDQLAQASFKRVSGPRSSTEHLERSDGTERKFDMSGESPVSATRPRRGSGSDQQQDIAWLGEEPSSAAAKNRRMRKAAHRGSGGSKSASSSNAKSLSAAAVLQQVTNLVEGGTTAKGGTADTAVEPAREPSKRISDGSRMSARRTSDLKVVFEDVPYQTSEAAPASSSHFHSDDTDRRSSTTGSRKSGQSSSKAEARLLAESSSTDLKPTKEPVPPLTQCSSERSISRKEQTPPLKESHAAQAPPLKDPRGASSQNTSSTPLELQDPEATAPAAAVQSNQADAEAEKKDVPKVGETVTITGEPAAENKGASLSSIELTATELALATISPRSTEDAPKFDDEDDDDPVNTTLPKGASLSSIELTSTELAAFAPEDSDSAAPAAAVQSFHADANEGKQDGPSQTDDGAPVEKEVAAGATSFAASSGSETHTVSISLPSTPTTHRPKQRCLFSSV